MSVIRFHDVSATILQSVSLELHPGMHCLLGSAEDGGAEFIELALGIVAPRRGRVLLDDTQLSHTPALRGRVAGCTADNRLPPGATVERGVQRALAALDVHASVTSVLEPLSLAALSNRRVAELSDVHTRQIALAIALAHSEASVLALWEPLSWPEAGQQRLVADRLRRAADAGAIVVVATASTRDALELSGEVTLLKAGRVVRHQTSATTRLQFDLPTSFIIRSDAPRRLAAELVAADVVTRVQCNADEGEVVVSGRDPAATALCIADAIRKSGCGVSSVLPSAPTLEAAHAALSGQARAAYDHAYRSALRSTAVTTPGWPRGQQPSASPTGTPQLSMSTSPPSVSSSSAPQPGPVNPGAHSKSNTEDSEK